VGGECRVGGRRPSWLPSFVMVTEGRIHHDILVNIPSGFVFAKEIRH
jgi:hypothetical protein